ncbi:MAG: hypothetical protein WAO76_13325 [Georgfuchsia sp.]
MNKILISVGIALGLSACSSTGTLQSPRSDAKISGIVMRGFFEPHRVEVSLDGKTYRGEWRTGCPTKEQKDATTYPHRKHIGQVQSTLKADDGTRLDCHWLTHGNTAEGACSGNGREYPLVLK